jgi:hypothetical protein
LKILLLNIALILLFTSNALAFTMPETVSVSMPNDSNKYYVDLDAGGGGNGSSGSPWNTLAAAKSGINGQSRPLYLYIKGSSSNLGEFSWNEGGSGSGNEVVFTAWGASFATINAFFRVAADWIIFDGLSQSSPQLTFRGDSGADVSMRVNHGVEDIVIRRLEILSDICPSPCAGLRVNGHNIYVYNNDIHDSNGSHGIYFNGDETGLDGTVYGKGNLVHDNDRNGIQFNPHEANEIITDAVLSGNAVYDNTESGIYLGSTSSGSAGIFGIDIYNNLTWGNAGGSDGGLHVSSPSGSFSDIVVYNNSFYDEVEWDWSGGTCRNNNYTSISGSGSPSVSSNNDTSPSYESVNDADADFLQITASNNGYDTNPPVTIGYFGNTRSSSAPDIGAHEYTAGGDTTDPTVTITSPTSDPTYLTADNSFDISGTASDNVGVTSVDWDNDAGSDGTCTGTTSWSETGIALAEGSNVITITAHDAAENTGTDVLTVTLDTTAPVTTISTSDPQTIGSDSLEITGTATDATGVTSCKYRIGSAPDAGNGTACSGTTSWTCSSSGYGEGANTVYVGCTDAMANWGNGDSITVNLDTTAPVISGVLPSGGQACTSDPRDVSLLATTDENATCKYDTADVAYSSMGDTFSTTGTTSHAQTLNLACDASYTYYIRCQDALNNANGSSSTASFSIGVSGLNGGARTGGSGSLRSGGNGGMSS